MENSNVLCHTFIILEILGHDDTKMTMSYIYVVNRLGLAALSMACEAIIGGFILIRIRRHDKGYSEAKKPEDKRLTSGSILIVTQ